MVKNVRQLRKNTFLSLFVLFNIMIWTNCQFTKHLNKERLYPYHNNLKVHYKVVHDSPEYSTIILKTHAHNYRLTIQAYSDPNRKELIFDKTEVISKGKDLTKTYKLPVNRDEYVLNLILTNTATNDIFKDVKYIDKNIISEQTLFAKKDDELLFPSYIAMGETIKFETTHANVKDLYVRYFKTPFKAARAPYVRNSREFIPQRGNSTITPIQKGKNYTFKESGLYLIQTDTLSKRGLFINCLDADFPKLTDIQDLIESTRYITKNVEYETMSKAREQKIALDEFWLARGGSKKRSKELIRLYYNRVQKANEYFTTYKEGWKTDRGIIFIIFGQPNKIQKSEEQEYWYYGATSQRDGVEFFFDKRNGQFILNRSSYMEFFWKTQMHEWRKGKIRDERF